MLPRVQSYRATFGALGVDKRQTDDNDPEGLPRVGWHVTDSNRLIRWQGAVGAAPQERRNLDNLVEDRDIVPLLDVLAGDSCDDGRLWVDFGGVFHGFTSLE